MSDQDHMVLRTFYLPPDLDDLLKRRAYAEGTTKGALIRRAVEMLIAESKAEAGR